MYRFSRSYLLFFSSLMLAALLLAGCGGGGSSSTGPGPVTTVTIVPTPTASIDIGNTIQFAATGKDSAGTTVFGTVTWASNNTAIDISNNGLVCGGKWDSLTTPIVCTPAPSPQVAQITATINGITSTATTLYVHTHIDNITVTPNDLAFPACISKDGTKQYTATAFAGGVPLTLAEVGPFNFIVSNASVGTNTAADQPAGQPGDQTTVKAVSPGTTTVIASNAGTTSVAVRFTVCGPATISLHVQSSTDTAFTIAAASTKQLAADVTDQNGTVLTGLTLTYTSSLPRAATVSTSGVVTGQTAGQATITAECAPGNCNTGVNMPIYSNPVVATITGTAPTNVVYVTSSEFTTETPVVLPITVSTNTVGTAIVMPDVTISGVTSKPVPNSMMANTTGARLFVGSDKGMVGIDTGNNSVIGTITNVPGRVISVSPNDAKVVIADSVASKTYVYDLAANTFDTLNGVATVAVWTPDSFKAYIVAGGTLYQYSTSLVSLRTIAIGDTGESVAMLPGGQFAYIARAAGALDARATCRNDSTYAPDSSIASDAGLQFAQGVALNTGTAAVAKMLDVGGANMTVDTPTISAPAASICPPGITSSSSSANWGVGFTPRQLIALPSGTKAYVTSDYTALLAYDVAGNTAYTVAVGGADTFTGGALTDGTKVYVGGSDGAVHVIDTATDLQTALIPITFNGTTTCAGTVCRPNLVTVRP